jgi:hypothetical protein
MSCMKNTRILFIINSSQKLLDNNIKTALFVNTKGMSLGWERNRTSYQPGEDRKYKELKEVFKVHRLPRIVLRKAMYETFMAS